MGRARGREVIAECGREKSCEEVVFECGIGREVWEGGMEGFGNGGKG